jgi:hypothetical protein
MPPGLAALLSTPGDGLMAKVGAALGTPDGALPSRMEGINNLMNTLPAPTRDGLLVEYMHELYRPS